MISPIHSEDAGGQIALKPHARPSASFCCTSRGDAPSREGGPNPRLTYSLPRRFLCQLEKVKR